MLDHKVCKNCGQRKDRAEYTKECPSSELGHDWEVRTGNGVTWSESYVGRLWKSKIGKILILGFVAYIFYKALF